jgi:GTP-binding protein SAR1
MQTNQIGALAVSWSGQCWENNPVAPSKVQNIRYNQTHKYTHTTLYRMDKISAHEPTRHPQASEVVVGNMKFNAHDLGGHAAARRLWSNYYSSVDAIVFLIDTADIHRFHESRDELKKLVTDPFLENTPILILGNKMDMITAVQRERVDSFFCVGEKTTQDVNIFMCSLINRTGYQDGFKWLSSVMK